MTTPLKVKTHGLLPYGIEFAPEQIATQSFNPDLSHTISLLAGYDGSNENIALVDKNGAVHVNMAASGFLHYKVFNIVVDSNTPASANVVFPSYVQELDFSINDNPINLSIMLSEDNAWGDTIQLPVALVNFKFITNALRIWCATSGLTSNVQVVGWW